jgi:alkanesulfonate monooxygenase SsuD/methylene tetrahydromethanopterin reductase-like flavin-dependent oxidoreductase (luciferase family)
MRFGIFSMGRGPYTALSDRFHQAEAMGFASAWVDDDLLTPGYSELEPWTLLGALARDTTSIRLGTMVTAITFRHPSLLAAQVATLNHISGGRAELGLGAGGPPNPYPAFSHTEWTPRERAERLEEYADVLSPLLRGETVTRSEPHYPVQDAVLPPGVQLPRVPLIVAAHGDRGLRVAARHADGWNSLGGQPYPLKDPKDLVTLQQAVAETKRLSDRLDGFCREAGRDPATVRRSVQALRPVPDPFASLDAFDAYVGSFAAIGIEEIIFYWPPIDLVVAHATTVPADRQALFERIVAERITPARDAARPER